ncbi:MAG: hypothetical protein M3033_09735 [Acidobacteriota bacterium]|nr:hypothetical protein [Acidobacteriota bacterium]
MSRKKISPNNNQTKSVRGAKKSVSLPFRYRLLMLACGIFLLVGFFFAARQHFASIDFSIKNNRLRKMTEELESDKRRLLLTKEIALSPAEIKKAAQKIGLTTISASNIKFFSSAGDKTEKPRAEKTDVAKPKAAAASKTETSAAEEKIPAKKIKQDSAADSKIKREAVQPTR